MKEYFRGLWNKRKTKSADGSPTKPREASLLREKYFREIRELRRRQAEERHKQHRKFHEEFARLHGGHRRIHHPEEFRRLHRSLRFLRPLALILNLAILYILFRWVGIRAIGIVFAFLIVAKEVAQLVFFGRLEKRVFQPVSRLKTGFAEIARGNYHVSLEPGIEDEFLGELIHSFNNMAAKLSESQRINSEYEENRKTLVANISHDLKTPITSIQGYLEMILEGHVSEPEKLKRYLRTIYNNSTYMNKLIDDLFLFSKLDLAKMDLNYDILKIRPFMSDLMAEFEFELLDRHHEFTYRDQMKETPSVRIDGKRVQQAIRNIIGNAVKYGPADLRVDTDLYAEGNFVCLSIRDNGPGIPEEKLPYIFDRFYRIDPERSKDLMSTGLGLAIARELIEAQEGEVVASSPAEGGTCFTIKLPIAGNAVNSDQKTSEPAGAAAGRRDSAVNSDEENGDEV
ncbi:Two component system, signal transduction histidine kinase [Acididesulfobacillus acetoxydans]|uniref:histidine kinase n=1 Tax=Acididesulfobacillus acetoxydans TaxID=1561005 RepID=A0A8S0X687_9FIRM|nr:Two component system, signal transduction histidine kinase [Acididesulfobacillus acetoxydans]CEJ08445.1 Sensor histidine kinase YycG [Acididesulfobacillus acetoxydans]